MPGAACKALNSFQLVAGCDLHKNIPPPPPVGPLPMAPHAVVYCIGFALPSTSKKSETVKAGWGHALGRQHDIGMGPYHFAGNLLLPLIWLAAGNKAEFGSGSVKIGVSGKPLRMAVALVPVLGLNLQLDCNEPCAFPSSTCVATFNTVAAGFTLGDCVGGFAAMIGDIAVALISSKIAGAITKGAGAIVMGILAEVSGGITVMLAAGLAAATFPTVAYYLGAVSDLVVGWAVGSPLGYSLSWAPGNVYGGKLNDWINNTFSDYISPTPPPPLPPASTTTPPTSSTPPSL
ncbi:MAG TPA: hypothetical protein VFG23_10630 [Polyangia bacterium]|nr:hypothetical protein [Polyangia bacterium]